MLDFQITNDIDNLQFIANVGYLCLSLALEDNENKINIYKDRLLLLNIGHKPFRYTVMDALNLISSSILSVRNSMADIKARDAIYKMEIADLDANPNLCSQIDFFKQRKDEFKEMINSDFFLPDRTKEDILNSGISNHNMILTYLENKIIINQDIGFCRI